VIKRALILVLVVSAMPFCVFSQLITNTGTSPSGLVQNVLLGPGVTVSNIMYNGSPSSIGSFTATGTNLGINQGIVMTTGTVLNNGSGPHGPNNQAGAGIDNGAGGSGLLTNLINGVQTYNAAILEFDFIPYSDTVKFKYVFGSDEYPEFAPPNNSGYNDVFGFFISGPGITGIQNIAKLPNNGSIVSINNVNAITNSTYYNFNGDGNTAPYNSNPFYIQYDGFTDVLTAVSKVQCGQTYHLILAVADVGDGQWDSGIFLEANSLSSQTPISIDYSISDTLFNSPSIMAEGCVSATVSISRENNLNTTLTIPIQISGTATSGDDYFGVPTSVTFSPGQSNVTFNITTNPDVLNENQETISLSFLLTDPCGNLTPQTITLTIQDVQPLNVSINDPLVPCPGDNITLVATVTGGLAPYNYSWSNGQTGNSISLSPTTSGFYSVTVTAQCASSSAIDTVFVVVPVYQPLEISTSADLSSLCPFVEEVFNVSATGGFGNYSYVWTSNGTFISTLDSISARPSVTTNYIITVSDECGSSISDTITYTILSPPLLTSINDIPEICPGDSVFISVNATGGFGNYHYYWEATGDTVAGIWVKPFSTTSYIVQVSDDCQTFSVPAIAQVIVVKPDADFGIFSQNLIEGLPITFQNLTQNGYVYDWYFSDGGSSILINPSHVFESPGEYTVTLVATDAKGCVDSITKPISIYEEFYVYIPNSFFPDGDRYNDFFSGSFLGVKWIKMEIFNRWGESLFYTEDQDFKWDGTYQNKRVPDGTYTWKLTYKPNRGIDEMMTGHVNVLR
jgi:gliding motility-associated-like protein